MADPIEVRVPPSKSLTQRALVLAGLAAGPCTIADPLDCDDSRAMARGLEALGVRLEFGASEWRVSPPPALRAPREPLVLGNAGTAVRFLTGLAPLIPGSYLVDGVEAMRRRPMPGLLDALRGLGVEVRELGRPGCPPVRLSARGSAARDERPRARLLAGASSQELSALLLAGAGQPLGARVEVTGSLPSRPYVRLTLSVLRAFGLEASESAPGVYDVRGGPPAGCRYRVEGDWSSASYPLAAGFLARRAVALSNLEATSEQADRVFPALLAELEGAGPRTLVLRDCPDLAPTLVACALFAEGDTTLAGASHLRVKESDRIGVTARELRKLGADLAERPDGLRIRPVPLTGDAVLDPAGDHRLAMAFGLVSLRVPGVRVSDPDCVTKSWPGYWGVLELFR